VDPQTSFLISLFLLLAAAILAGEIALRLGQTAFAGQLLAGVVLGPAMLGPYIGISTITPQLSAVQFLATFFVLFMAGLQMRPDDIFSMSRSTVALGLSVFFVPFATAFVVVSWADPGLGALTTLFISVAVSITALPVMAILVHEFGLTDTKLGRLVMTTALVNEIVAVTVFGLLLQIRTFGPSNDVVSLAIALLAVFAFLTGVLAIHQLLKSLRETPSWKAAMGRYVGRIRSRQASFAALMVLGLGAALFSQFLGLTFVLGAFYAGILVTPESVGEELYEQVKGMLGIFMWGFFIPLFFAITGLETNFGLIGTVTAVLGLLALLLAAVMSKVAVGAALARAIGWSGPDSLALGFMVNCRGAVEIAMAVILYNEGILNVMWFTIVVTVGIVTTLVAPVGAVAAWKLTPASRSALYQRAPALAPGGLSTHFRSP
jgi:Kef-type K+ transport system membrane component KefB